MTRIGCGIRIQVPAKQTLKVRSHLKSTPKPIAKSALIVQTLPQNYCGFYTAINLPQNPHHWFIITDLYFGGDFKCEHTLTNPALIGHIQDRFSALCFLSLKASRDLQKNVDTYVCKRAADLFIAPPSPPAVDFFGVVGSDNNRGLLGCCQELRIQHEGLFFLFSLLFT